MDKAVRVVPAILTDDLQVLIKMLKQSETFTDYVQIDIMDNKFVPSRSITWEQIEIIPPTITWEAHLMVEQPETHFENYRRAGAGKVIFHYEATSFPERVIKSARELKLGVGIALNPETEIFRITPLIDQIDSVLFLSVHPGFYGAKFIPEVLNKISELRQIYPDLKMSIDGGIKESNIHTIAQTGVDEICVGSAIFLQFNPAEAYRRLTQLANN